jgi:phosphatidylserine decarboxylase
LIAKGGIAIVAVSFAIFLVFFLVWLFNRNSIPLFLAVLTGLIFLFNLYFFRDPERTTPDNSKVIISAADGKVVQIVEEFEPNYFHEQVRRVSIFLSVFNVHVNRIPITGTVDYLEYFPGKFFAAYKEEASQANEQYEIGIAGDSGYRIMFKQIAGIIARRIVCNLIEGQPVKAGDRMGMIRYGSRVDMYFPLSAKVMVDIGEKVRGGETIIAIFKEEDEKTFEEARINEVPELEEI